MYSPVLARRRLSAWATQVESTVHMARVPNSRISQLLSMTDGDVLSPEQAAELNLQLSRTSTSEFSPEDSRNIADYIATALNMDSIDVDIRPSLESLLEALQRQSK